MTPFWPRFRARLESFQSKLKFWLIDPEKRRRLLLFFVGAAALIGAVFFFVGVENLLKIFRPRAAEQWTETTSLYKGRTQAQLVYAERPNGEKWLYLIGGLEQYTTSDNTPSIRYIEGVERLRLNDDGTPPSTAVWEGAGTLNQGRAAFGAVYDNNKDRIWAIAGDIHLAPDEGGQLGLTYSTIEYLDLDADVPAWQLLPAYLTSVNFYPEVKIFNDEIRIIGGIYGNPYYWGHRSQTGSGDWLRDPLADPETENGLWGQVKDTKIGDTPPAVGSYPVPGTSEEGGVIIVTPGGPPISGSPTGGAGGDGVGLTPTPGVQAQQELPMPDLGRLFRGSLTDSQFFTTVETDISLYLSGTQAGTERVLVRQAGHDSFLTLEAVLWQIQWDWGSWPEGSTTYYDARLGNILLVIGVTAGVRDPETGQQTIFLNFAPYPQGRYGHQVNEINQELWLTGGASWGYGELRSQTLGQLFRTSPFWVLDDGNHPLVPYQWGNSTSYVGHTVLKWVGSAWQGTEPFPLPAGMKMLNGKGRAFHKTVLLNRELSTEQLEPETLLVAGGLQTFSTGSFSWSTDLLKSAALFKPAQTSNFWSEAGELKEAVYDALGGAIGDKAYIAGGMVSGTGFIDANYLAPPAGFPSTPRTNSYQATSNTWIQGNDMPFAATFPAQAEVITILSQENKANLLIYAAGGGEYSTNSQNLPQLNGVLNRVQYFGPVEFTLPAELDLTKTTIELSKPIAEANGQDPITATITLQDKLGNPMGPDRYQVRLTPSLPASQTASDYHPRTSDTISPNTFQSNPAIFTLTSTESTAPGRAYFKVGVLDTRHNVYLIIDPAIIFSVQFQPAITAVFPPFIQPGRIIAAVTLEAYGTHFRDTTNRGGSPTAVGFFRINPGLTVDANPKTILADGGLATSTVKATLTNADGTRGAGRKITFSVREGGGKVDGFTSVSRQTGATGQVSVTYRSDITPGPVVIKATSDSYTNYVFLFEESASVGPLTPVLKVIAEPATLTADTLAPSTVTATYSIGGSPIPGQALRLYLVPLGNQNDYLSIDLTTDANGQATYIYTATADEGRVKLMAFNTGNNIIPVGAHTTIEQKSQTTTTQLTVSNLNIQNATKLSFTLSASPAVLPGTYLLVVLTSDSYSVTYRDINTGEPKSGLVKWSEGVGYPFTVTAATSGILDYLPKAATRGDQGVSFTLWGGSDTTFVKGSTQLSLTKTGSQTGIIVTVTGNSADFHTLSATLDIASDAPLGWWEIEATTQLADWGAPVTWSVPGNQDFLVKPTRNYLIEAAANPSHLSNDSISKSTITAHLWFFNETSGELEPIGDQLLLFARNFGDDGQIVSPRQDVTGQDGRAFVTYQVGSGSTAVVITVADSDNNPPAAPGTATITKGTGGDLADPNRSTFTADPSAVPVDDGSGSAYSTLTATIKNSAQVPLDGKRVTISYEVLSGDPQLKLRDIYGNKVSSLVTDIQGRAIFHASSTAPGKVRFLATVEEVVLTQEPVVEFYEEERINVNLTINVLLEKPGKNYQLDRRVWAVVKTAAETKVDREAALEFTDNTSQLVFENLSLIKNKNVTYTVWVKGVYHRAKSKTFTADSSSKTVTLDLAPIGDLAGTIEGWRKGFFDNIINTLDFAVLLSQWQGSGTADLNGDGKVNTLDFAILLINWGRGDPKP